MTTQYSEKTNLQSFDDGLPSLTEKEETKATKEQQAEGVQAESGTSKTGLSVKHAKPKRNPDQPSLATVWQGTTSVQLRNVGEPLITEPGDAIVKITLSAICGSDLHLYGNEVPGKPMQKGDVLGHEGVGIITDVGSEVKNFKKGDRVVIAFPIACGECRYCKKKMFTLCDTTNASADMKKLYGQNLGGIFGYSHLTGGYDGLQAEHARVPLADHVLHKLPDSVSDEMGVLVSDVCCTSWHGNELAEVNQETETVAVFGAGPIGLCTAYLAKFRGAKRVFVIDHHDWRLERAKMMGLEPINFDEVDVVEKFAKMLPNGVEKCIDCVGYRFPKTVLHKALRAVKLETDVPEVIDVMFKICQKGGNIALIGDYFGIAHGFPIGAMMEKGFTVRGGQAFVQRYWDQILEWMEQRAIDPTFVISHSLELEDVAEGYDAFYNRKDGMIKPVLRTKAYAALGCDRRAHFYAKPKCHVGSK